MSPQQTHRQVSQDLFSHSIFELQLTSYTREQELHRDYTAGPIIRFPFLLCHHLLLTSTSHLGPFYFPKRIRPLSAKRHYSCYFSVWNLLSPGVLWVHFASPLGLCKNALFSQAHYPLKNGHRFTDTLDSHPLMYFSLHIRIGQVIFTRFCLCPLLGCTLHYTFGVFLRGYFQLISLLPNLFCSGFPPKRPR